MKSQQHIPTLIAMLMLILGLGGAIFLIENGSVIFARAVGSAEPKEVTITNVSNNSFTVNWITDIPAISFLQYGKKSLLSTKITAFDNRDEKGKLQSRQVHSISITDLVPNTEYDFVIVSKNTTYNNDKYLVTTGFNLQIPNHTLEPSFGILTDAQNQLVDQAIVYASFEGSQIVSSLVNRGSWVLPLGTLRSNDLNRYFIPSKSDEERIFFVNSKGKATVRTNIENDSPLPAIKLGETYDFTKKQTGNPGLIIAQAQANEQMSATINFFQITSPSVDAAIPSGKPSFKGSGLAQKNVILTISGNFQAQSGKVTIDKNGLWVWTPFVSLSPGNYTITAVSFDKEGKPITLTQPFIILKSGSQVLQAATPSASLAPSPTLSPSPTPTVKPSPSATLRPTPSPTLAATPAATASPGAVPTTGTLEPTLALLLGGIILMFFGVTGLAREKSIQSRN